MNIEIMKDSDWPQVSHIYTQAIEIGLSSVLDKCPDFDDWDAKHFKDLRFVMRDGDKILGWAALMPYSDRCAYRGVAEASNQYRKHQTAGKLWIQIGRHP
jgi:L-amino acid N-acyltransferase YncA